MIQQTNAEEKALLERLEEAYPKKFWAERYHISERTISRAIANGSLDCIRFGRIVRITPSQFAKYLASLGYEPNAVEA